MEKLKRVLCALVGHSRIQTQCFGYFYCGRCGEQVGDSLGGAYNANHIVIMYHDCDTCRDAAKSLTWKDRLLVPDPFDPVKCAEERDAVARARAAIAELRAKRAGERA